MSTKSRSGLTLLETILSFSLFFAAILGGLDFFSRGRRLYFRVSAAQDASERAHAALERLRLDILETGAGLAEAVRLGLVSPIDSAVDGLTLTSADRSVALASAIVTGATIISLPDGEGFSSGRRICLLDGTKGEIATIRSVDASRITLAAGTSGSYVPEATTLILLREVTVSWDEADFVVRRKINASSAQPLVEDVSSFRWGFDAAANLVRVGLRLKSNPENEYAVAIFPKNAALVQTAAAR